MVALEEEFDQVARYYLDPVPDRVPAILDRFIRSGVLGNIDSGITAFLFGRIAQRERSLWPAYEEVLRQLPTEIAGSTPVVEFADALRRVATADPDGPMNPMNRPTTTSRDLDELWTEFFVTGEAGPVDRIISVLDGPDLVRTRLEEWLGEPVNRSVFNILLGPPRERTAKRLAELGIVFDSCAGTVTTSDDLDCLSVLARLPMQDSGVYAMGFVASPELFASVRKALPFELSDADAAYVAMKASAKWSLASNALQHPRVREVCQHPVTTHGPRADRALNDIDEMIRFSSPNPPVWHSESQ